MSNGEVPTGSYRVIDLSNKLQNHERNLDIATISSVSKNGEEKSLENNRVKVAQLLRSFFMSFDERAAHAIGFNASILEELYKRRPQPFSYKGFNRNGMDHRLILHIDNAGNFAVDLNDKQNDQVQAKFLVDSSIDFTPKIYARTSDGSVKVEVSSGPDHVKFDNVRIERSYNGRDGSFSHTRTVSTYERLYPGDQDVPLILDERHRDGTSIRMIYGNITESGDVELIDRQRVFINPHLPHVWGWYIAAKKLIAFEETGLKASTSEDDGKLIINTGGNARFVFPIRTNIYDELMTYTSEVESRRSDPFGETG